MESSKLAAYVASRICHDVSSPLQSLMQACELFDMGGAMREEGEKSLRDAVAKLNAKVKFLRFAVGSQAINDGYANINEAKELFTILFGAGSKTELEWKVETHRITNRQMRVLMNMALVMMGLAVRGVCQVAATEEGGELVLSITAVGQFAQIKSELQEALTGQEPTGGWGGGAIQPFLTLTLAGEIGFTLTSTTEPGKSSLIARGPIGEG